LNLPPLNPLSPQSPLRLPDHLAIIMDGNGRWAELRGRERTYGHVKGARVAKAIIERCAQLGVRHLTLYAFSTENWLRPKPEVTFLMRLLGRHLRRERATLMRNNIRFSTIGDIDRLPAAVAQEARLTASETGKNDGMRLTFALSYGSRQEIANAVRALCEKVARGELQPAQIDESAIAAALETASAPDPDLIVRTSGEHRLSNFLLWQAAYSELYVTEALWPDFNEAELQRAFAHFSCRERRFGRTRAQTAVAAAEPKGASAAFARALGAFHALGK
jgi:undecaprenyl diphosphate synthase